MKQHLHFPLRASALAAAALLLSACAGLHDVDNQWCAPEEPVAVTPTPAPTVEHISLQADALFRFDKSDVQDMLPAGRAELNELASKITSGWASIDSIELVGHTDRLGSQAYNQPLSERRAATVRDYLQSQGVNVPISAHGVGKSQPTGQTDHCQGNVATPELTQCLQPDRRVEVQITGVRKN